MKKCPYCAEEIQDDAAKCRHCGEWLDKSKKPRWYYSKGSLIVSFCIVGPFMLPLVWFNPRLSKSAKAVWTVGVVVLTILVIKATAQLWQYYKKMYDDLMGMHGLG